MPAGASSTQLTDVGKKQTFTTIGSNARKLRVDTRPIQLRPCPRRIKLAELTEKCQRGAQPACQRIRAGEVGARDQVTGIVRQGLAIAGYRQELKPAKPPQLGQLSSSAILQPVHAAAEPDCTPSTAPQQRRFRLAHRLADAG